MTTADVSYSQARLGRDRNPTSETVLVGSQEPIRPELRDGARQKVEALVKRLGWDEQQHDELLEMLGLDEP